MLSRVSTAAAAVLARLKESHEVETRIARYERFVKLSAKGKDPLGGREFCFTASAKPAVTGAANLPDSAWPFDSAALTAGITRGAQIYYDGFPLSIGPNLPWAVRFSRPASGGAWVEDGAWKIYGGFGS